MKIFARIGASLFIITLLGFFSFVSVNTVGAGAPPPDRTASVSGNWNDTATWGGLSVPTSLQSVDIADGITVNVTENAEAYSVTLAEELGSTGNMTLNIDPGVTLTTGQMYLYGNDFSAILNIGDGNLVLTDDYTGGLYLMSDTAAVNIDSGTITAPGGISFGISSLGELVSTGDSTIYVGDNMASGGILTTSGTGTIIFNEAGAQTIGDYSTYNNVTLTGSGEKSFSGNSTINGVLTIGSGVVAELVLTTPTAQNLYFDDAFQPAGTYGPVGSGADFENDTYFSGSGGLLTVLEFGEGGFSGAGTGVEGDPYIITSCAELMEVNDFLDAYFELSTDLDCTLNGNDAMIGTFLFPFTGSFEGNGNIITIDVDTDISDYAGLFRSIDGGVIANLGVAGSVNGASYVGGLVGYANDTDIDSSFSTATVTGTEEFTGGFAGYINGDAALVTNSYATGEVIGGTENTGGFVGEVDGEASITYSYATGAVSTSSIEGIDIGGFAGDIDNSTVAYSYATGDVSGVSYVGGFVGDADTNTVIWYSYAYGRVEGTEEKVGGFIGDAVDGVSIIDSYTLSLVEGVDEVGGFAGNIQDSILTNVYSAGSSVIGDTRVGGLVGDDDGGNTFTMTFFDTETSGLEDACGEGDCAGVAGDLTEDMKNRNNFNPYTGDEYGFLLGDVETYRYVKWEIGRIKDGSDTDCWTGDVCTQVSEFELTYDGFRLDDVLSHATITSPDSVSPSVSQEVGSLVDNEIDTKFLDGAFSTGGDSSGLTEVIIDFGEEVSFNGYNWATANDMDNRDPISWTLMGSDDGVTYSVIDAQEFYADTMIGYARDTFLRIQNENWDFYETWGIDSEGINNVGYPFLQWQGFDYEYEVPIPPYVITEVTPIPATTTETSPIYHFAMEGEGEAELIVDEGCGDDVVAEELGSNPEDQGVQFRNLEAGETYHCRIYVNSDAGLSNALDVGPFTILASSGGSSGTSLPQRIKNLRSQGKIEEAQKIEDRFKLKTNISTPNLTPPLTRLLKFKMTGEDIHTMQKLLNKKGYILATVGAGAPGFETPLFGLRTLAAIKKFQRDHGLLPDGIVGPLTWGMLTQGSL